MLAYVSTPRYEGLEFDREIAAKDSKALFKAGEKKLGTDEKTFIHIFSERSKAQLAAIISAYHDMYGNSLKKVYIYIYIYILSNLIFLFLYFLIFKFFFLNFARRKEVLIQS